MSDCGCAVSKAYELAKEAYAAYGIDTDAVMDKLADKAISIQCWQGDDVMGFDQKDNAASGGILTTGNYPGRARTFEELTADFEKAASLIPGKKRINLHASYAVFTPENPWVDRDQLEYKHFAPWVEWAKEKGFGIDFNPTLFSHPKMNHDCSVSSPDKETRDFWIRHCVACRKIAERIGEELDDMVLNNFWIPDGLKDVPADRYGMRERLRESLDEIYSFETPHVIDSVEQKVFGIGLEGFTTGNNEFYISYAAKKGGNHVVLIDAGHFNPTESIADKLPSLLQFFPYVPLHVTRPMHWDSDHVVLFDDNIRDIASEVVRCPGGFEKIIIGLDFFDASINRIGAWATGTRAMEKSLLFEMLQPWDRLKELQDTYQFSEKMMVTEQFKSMPFGAVWDYYCRRENVPLDGELWAPVKAYEDEVLSARA
ncbi:MAG: L-rhamnose isomerase [Coriobacteriia bacterium]|nr:L-rhamnose isomerase [Coriobacteriia bacterium]